VAVSCRSASRTGVRERLKRFASPISSSRAPGESAPRKMSSAICWRTVSASVRTLFPDMNVAPGRWANVWRLKRCNGRASPGRPRLIF
jgi:hypothetical protein